ncbi:MAG TPA: hypothetical protein VM008_16660 [Phycisphaerae bacterium]|nr:hypothetical protein [Phycisphaerae bacterium]
MTHFGRALVCGLLMGATATVGFGQYQRSTGGVQQVQPQGNALDASPQVGSGGSNNPITGYVPMNANNYVTGNVSGLGGFNQSQSVVNVNGVNVPVNNWNTGTQSPYTFRGDVGQNSSFNNWIRTSSGGLQTTPYSAANAYYSSSQLMSGAQGSIYSSPYGSGYQSSLVPSYAMNPGAASMAGGYSGVVGGGLSIRQFSASPANVNADAGNSSGLASPLFSGRVTGNALGVNPGLNSVNQNNVLNLSPNQGNRANGSNNSNAGTGGNMSDDQMQREKLAKPTDLSTVARVDGQVTSGERIEGQSQRVQEANVLPEGEMLAQRSQVNDTYRTMMGELEKAQSAAKKKEEMAKANPSHPEKNEKGETVASNGNGSGNTGDEQAQQDMGNGASGANSNGANSSGQGKAPVNPYLQTQSTDPTKPGYRPKSMQAMRPVRVEEMSTSELQAGKSVPEMKSFGRTATNATPTPFDELMKKAEGLLKEGKYLDAANAYQVAMLEEPSNPLAVLGRGNAELGAGMYESAAGDLKYIFTRQPELISVKYALEDYIPPQRQHQLIADLTELSTGKGVGNTAAFLLCYLDYNTGRKEELQHELGRWEARPWKDRWQGVMKRALGNGGE